MEQSEHRAELGGGQGSSADLVESRCSGAQHSLMELTGDSFGAIASTDLLCHSFHRPCLYSSAAEDIADKLIVIINI